jgi:hypothetical protein
MMAAQLLKDRPCQKCGKLGLDYCNHPHAAGYKDSTRVRCRFCKTTYKIYNQRTAADNETVIEEATQ